MKISVIIPVYNAEIFLHKCIQSVLNQSFTEFELLLINDGSVDKSESICNQYSKQDGRIRVFHQVNKGVSAARNVGIENASGDWFYFMDADDTINKDLFSILENIDNDTEVVQFGFNKIEKDKNIISFSPNKNCEYPTADDFIRNVTYKTFTLWTHFIKASLIKDNDLKFTEGQKYAEDLEFTIKAYAYASGIKTNTYIGYNYFVHEESAMARAYTFENAELHLSVAKQLIDFCEINNLKIGDFMSSRLEYMIKSFFSYSKKIENVDLKHVKLGVKILFKDKRFKKNIRSRYYILYNFPVLYLKALKFKIDIIKS